MLSRRLLFIEVVEQFAAGPVEPFDAGPVAGDRFTRRELEIFLQQVLRRRVRRVRQHRRIPDQERLVAGLLDESIDRFQALRGRFPALVAVATAFALALRHGVGEAGGLDRIAFPPFARLQGT